MAKNIDSMIARGDTPSMPTWPACRSVLPGVSDAAWTKFVRVLSTQALGAVSDSNGIGCFEMRPRRLVDLGLMADIRRIKKGERWFVYDGTFVLPLTMQKFLASPIDQYNALAASMEKYDAALKTADGMSRAGALAICHRAGPEGLKSWIKRKVPSTAALYERAKDIF